MYFIYLIIKFITMNGELAYEEIEEVLQDQLIGRIGCNLNGKTYIVPVNYVYNDPYVYIYSLEGKKVDIMRKNMEVCFEVEVLWDSINWKSVVAWGTFEELKGREARQKAWKLLSDRSLNLISNDKTELTHTPLFKSDNVNDIEGIFYRIFLKEKTGRSKNSFQAALF